MASDLVANKLYIKYRNPNASPVTGSDFILTKTHRVGVRVPIRPQLVHNDGAKAWQHFAPHFAPLKRKSHAIIEIAWLSKIVGGLDDT